MGSVGSGELCIGRVTSLLPFAATNPLVKAWSALGAWHQAVCACPSPLDPVSLIVCSAHFSAANESGKKGEEEKEGEKEEA